MKVLWTRWLTKALKVFSQLWRHLPLSFRRKTGQLLGYGYGLILRIRWFTQLKNIRIVFPHWSKAEIFAFHRKTLYWLGYYALQYLEVAGLKNLEDRPFRFFGLENLRQAKSQGRGYFLLSCHLGNPDMGLKGVALSGEKIAVISKKFSHSLSNEVWFALRQTKNLSFIDPHGPNTAYQIFSYLAKGEGVVFVLDQFMGPPYGIESEFFGRKTGTAFGLSRFFLKTKAPVVPVFGYENSEGEYEIHYLSPIFYEDHEIQTSLFSIPDRLQREAWLVRRFNKEVESMILRVPEHWMWIHRRWKKWEIR